MSHFATLQMLDENGVPRKFKFDLGTQPIITAQTYLQAVAEGDIAGHVPWSKIGFTPVMNTTESDIWGASGVYVFPAVAGTWEVVSSDNTQDKGTVIKGAMNGSVTSDAGGTTTTLVDADVDFTAATAVAVGDCVLLDPNGTTPEWGYVTTVAAHTLTVAGGFSSGGTGASRKYAVVDKSASTHAQVVRLEYLDSTYETKSELVVLNGTTAVATVGTSYFRINSFRIVAAGSSAKCLGNLTLRASGGGTTYSYMQAGYTRARNIIYTVPLGKTLYVTQYSASYSTTGNANKEYARIYTRANVDPTNKFSTDGIFHAYTEITMQNSTIIIPFESPTILPAKTDIKVSGIATATGVASCVLRGWLE